MTFWHLDGAARERLLAPSVGVCMCQLTYPPMCWALPVPAHQSPAWCLATTSYILFHNLHCSRSYYCFTLRTWQQHCVKCHIVYYNMALQFGTMQPEKKWKVRMIISQTYTIKICYSLLPYYQSIIFESSWQLILRHYTSTPLANQEMITVLGYFRLQTQQKHCFIKKASWRMKHKMSIQNWTMIIGTNAQCKEREKYVKIISNIITWAHTIHNSKSCDENSVKSRLTFHFIARVKCMAGMKTALLDK